MTSNLDCVGPAADGERALIDLLDRAGRPGALFSDVAMLNSDVTAAAVVDETGEQVTALALDLEERHFLDGQALDRVPATVVASMRGRRCGWGRSRSCRTACSATRRTLRPAPGSRAPS